MLKEVYKKADYLFKEFQYLTSTCVMDVWERRMVNFALVICLQMHSCYPLNPGVYW